MGYRDEDVKPDVYLVGDIDDGSTIVTTRLWFKRHASSAD